jgi:hypothetical protein
MKKNQVLLYLFLLKLSLITNSCIKQKIGTPTPEPEKPKSFTCTIAQIDSLIKSPYRDININPVIRLSFTDKVDTNSMSAGIQFLDDKSVKVPYTYSLIQADTVLEIRPSSLKTFSKYTICLIYKLQSKSAVGMSSNLCYAFTTQMDTTDKFPIISDEELLDLVQKRTFKYFWDYGHPVSGMARERNSSGDIVTSGGTGFGIMAMVVASSRNFITRNEAANKLDVMLDFMTNKCQKFHGAFPHWLNGSTGAVIPFSTKDNGADLVETSYLMQGLLTARQYFNANNSLETGIRNKINALYNGVEWNWFRKSNEQVLYWHWSANLGWAMNMQIRGWNECLITYVMAASSPTDSIPASVYHNGWARNGGFKNGASYYGYKLPLGSANGGPLFFSHYSFMGINPNQLTDLYANYWEQNQNHTLINYSYCVANPKKHYGYSNKCWGLTASDNNLSGYAAHEPNNDPGVISPTAALSAMPYTPENSMRALKFFYYKLGDKMFKEQGFVDAINLNDQWFANSYLAIDQGPIIVMIENYRSGLCWNLFMSCPEVKTGMKKCGFNSPFLN